MTKICQYIKANGQRCRGWAITGSQPPRCASHRQDGGPLPPLIKGSQLAHLKATHGYYSQLPFQGFTFEHQAAQILLKHYQLSTQLASATDSDQLSTLFYLHGRNLASLLQLLKRYHRLTGQHPDTLLQKANGQPLAQLRTEYEALHRQIKKQCGSTYPTTSKRSPRYWLIYNFIRDYINKHHLSPKYREIKKACNITSDNVVRYWLKKLQQDGLITIQPHKPRGINLIHD